MTISKTYLLRLTATDPEYAALYGIPKPKFSDRLKIFRSSGAEQPRYLAERQHLINLRHYYPKYKKQIGSILRSEAHIKNSKVPYTLD